jgi:hypothetical protein
MTRWISALIEPIIPAFGGFPTFCEDPDGLLEYPEVRECLRKAGMVIGDWDGDADTLKQWETAPEDAMPLVVVSNAAKRHLVELALPDNRWVTISVGGLMPRFYAEVVKTVPTAMWDRLLDLNDQERYKRPPQETAILIGRALYGIDPEYLKHGDGWISLLARLATNGEGVPTPIAKAVVDSVQPPTYIGAESALNALVEPGVARIVVSRALEEHDITESLPPTEKLLLAQLACLSGSDAVESSGYPDLTAEWKSLSGTAEGVLRFGSIYADALDHGLPAVERLETNRRFTAWIMQNYPLIQNAPNPATLRLPTLLRQIDSETENERLLFIVVDALSLQAWNQVRRRWVDEGVIGRAVSRVAFAILPTITPLSRRAIFEEKLPVSFSGFDHTPRLERTLWKNRFQQDGEYFGVYEEAGILDSFAVGKRRVCVVDISWDRKGHSIDPRTDSITDSARSWAGRTPLRQIIQKALTSSYRVMLTSDHGQLDCFGKGRLNVGDLPEERSKRVLLFSDAALCQSFVQPWTTAYRPTGLKTDCHPLFANDFDSFDFVGAGTVSHGGMSLDEVLVPVVEVFG